MDKPATGWLHPDQNLQVGDGVYYPVKVCATRISFFASSFGVAPSFLFFSQAVQVHPDVAITPLKWKK
jgi:hypothetical protein